MKRFLFIQQTLFESFGVEYVSAALKSAGHECSLYVLSADGRRGLPAAVSRFRPDVLAFSVTSLDLGWALPLARELREGFRIPTLFGGAHPTFFPEMVQDPAVDYVCRGEGDQAVVEFATALEEGAEPREIANLAHADADGLKINPLRPLVGDLDALPFPDREPYFRYAALRELPYKRFMVGRGCPYACTYCFNHAQQRLYRGLGRYVRHRSAMDVVREIDQVLTRYGGRTVGFIDDTFTVNRRWTLEFLSLYREHIGRPFTCLVRIDELDEEVVEALARAGCTFVSFGLETGSERLRKTVLRRRISNETIERNTALLRRFGIPFLTYNMFGIPGESVDEALETVRFNARIGTSLVATSILVPFPGTQIFELCKNEGLLQDDETLASLDRITSTSPLRSTPDLRYLENLQKIGWIAVRWPATFGMVRRLARLRLGALYSLLYKLSLFFRYKVRYNLRLIDMVRLGLRAGGSFG